MIKNWKKIAKDHWVDDREDEHEIELRKFGKNFDVYLLTPNESPVILPSWRRSASFKTRAAALKDIRRYMKTY